jgi:DNA-binding IclR family transcriptional regulator
VLGWSAAPAATICARWRRNRWSASPAETGVTVVLCACSRHDLVCIDRKTGDYPIKVFTVEIGIRRPLGVGAGSIAVLASMPEDQAMAALDAVKDRLKAYSDKLRRGIVPAVRAARKTGYAVSDGFVLPNVRAAGVALRDQRGVAIGSLGIAAIADYATDGRLAEFAALLKREQTRIERALREHLAARARLVPPAKSKARRRTRTARA